MITDLAREILKDGPKVYWPLEGDFKDYSPANTPITTLPSSYKWNQEKGPGGVGGIHLGGVSMQRAVVSTVVNDFTMEILYKPNVLASNDAIIFYNGSSGANGWGVTQDLNKTIQFLAGGVAQGGNSVPLIDTGRWSMLHIIRRATAWEYWLNGNLIFNTGTNTPGTPGTATVVGSNMVALFAHAAIFETPLLPGRIKAHADAWLSESKFQLRTNRAAFTLDDAATIPLDISVYEVETFDTVYLDLQASGTEFKETLDAATVYLELSVLGGECYSTAQINAEADVNPVWVADTMTQFAPVTDNDINPQFVVADIIRSGVPC